MLQLPGKVGKSLEPDILVLVLPRRYTVCTPFMGIADLIQLIVNQGYVTAVDTLKTADLLKGIFNSFVQVGALGAYNFL